MYIVVGSITRSSTACTTCSNSPTPSLPFLRLCTAEITRIVSEYDVRLAALVASYSIKHGRELLCHLRVHQSRALSSTIANASSRIDNEAIAAPWYLCGVEREKVHLVNECKALFDWMFS